MSLEVKKSNKGKIALLSVFFIVILIVWGLLHNNAAQANPSGMQAQPPVPVMVMTVKEQPIRTWSTFSGRTQAVNYAEIRPEVSGRITKIRFQDGQTVKAGDVLFVIDPRTYEAAVSKAQADLDSAKSNVQLAKLQFDRAKGLVDSQAIAQEVYDQRFSAYQAAKAAVEGAQAQLDNARIDLDRAYVKAPISGRVARAEITVGNLVNAGPGAPVLTSIVSNDGIYADFEVDEQTYLQSIRAQAQGMQQEQQIPVILTLADENNRTYHGKIYSFDNRIDNTSGTIRARAKFTNEDGSLVPGMFVAIKMASSYEFKGILIPDRAVSSDQSKKFVYVVSDDKKVVYRGLELGQEVDGQRIVIAGLKVGDRVIVDGLQHVRPDSIVDPQDITSVNPNAKPVESVQ